MMERTWDLSFLYGGFQDEKYLEDLKSLPELAQNAAETLRQPGDPVAVLERFLDQDAVISDKAERLALFCNLTLSVEAENADAAAGMDKLNLCFNQLSLLRSALVRYIGALPDLEAVIAASPKLQEVAFALREFRGQAAHLIPEEIEPWLLKMSLSGGTAFSQLRDKLDATHLVDYRGEQLPLSAVRGLAYDPDPQVRKDAYEAEIAAYRKIEIPMAACLNSIKQEAITRAEAQRYASVLDMTLQESRMDARTLEAMLTAIREFLPDFRRYLRAKGALLGHPNGLPFYDLFAPVGKAGKTYTVEEAHGKLLQEMGKFTPEMAAFMDKAFRERWIDFDPRPGKTGGAFCAGCHTARRSSILTNFQGSFSDVSTLAHELGHAWHNHCMEGLPVMLTDVPMQLAETASIFNETMLSYQALSSAGPEEQLNLLENSLMEATQTVVDIYSRYLFETAVIETRPDHAMSVEELKEAMLQAQDASYGEGLDPDIRHPYMWACKSHYYSSGLNFYNFPYAFGLLFGKGVFARYLDKGAAFVPEYCRLLRSCGSGTIADVAASVGIDVRSADFWRSSLAVIRSDIDRFCSLCKA